MIDKKHKTCKKCNNRPLYNYKGEKMGIYCKEHKLDDMIDVLNKTCIIGNCELKPSYNYKGKKEYLYCKTHKLDDMVDIKHKTCIIDNCEITPFYNYKGKKTGLYCSGHKLDGMIDVKNKTCKNSKCGLRPCYNYENEKEGIYCKEHKKNNMIDVINLTCKSGWCDIYVRNDKNDGYCLNCFIHLFPDKPVSRNYKTKEKAVVDYVKENFKDIDLTCDKTVKEGCSRRRPDIFIDLGYQVIIVEVDENQHQDYDCSCENKRLMELSQDVNHRPTVFIRFNPDDYKDGRKNITSCWSLNKQNVITVKKN
jgi:hypothetical protein